MPTSLVTGAAGFIGSHVVDNVLMMGHDVVALDDLSGGFEENINPKAEFIKGSVEDYELVQEIFERYRFDYVYHLAAYAAEGLSHFIKRFNYTNNLLGSINLINASINSGTVKVFVFTSSIAVYGRNQLPMTEELTPNPEDPYGIAKYAVELDLKESHEMFGLNYIIFRPHNVYGPDMGREHVIPEFVIRMKKLCEEYSEGPLEFQIQGTGKETRAFCYINDFIDGLMIVLGNGEHLNIYHIGTQDERTISEVAQTVSEYFKRVINIKAGEEARGGTTRRCPDIGKLQKLGYKPKWNFRDGVFKLAEWYVNHVKGV